LLSLAEMRLAQNMLTSFKAQNMQESFKALIAVGA
jgi:hypothetical protein